MDEANSDEQVPVATAVPPPPPESPVAVVPAAPDNASPAAADAEPPAQPSRTACDVLFARGEEVARSKALEQAARAGYVRHVLRKKLDNRDFAHHPLLISTRARSAASVAAACVEEWAGECPHCVIYRTDFAREGTYGVVLLEFNDAGDGEYVYFVFLNDDDHRVAAIARESNFRP